MIKYNLHFSPEGEPIGDGPGDLFPLIVEHAKAALLGPENLLIMGSCFSFVVPPE